jgi:hypothetical protein
MDTSFFWRLEGLGRLSQLLPSMPFYKYSIILGWTRLACCPPYSSVPAESWEMESQDPQFE